MTADGVKRIGIVGAGAIGASWAAYFLSHGLAVRVFDPAPNTEDYVRRFVANTGAPSDALSFAATAIAAVEGADFVQESGPEREDLKVALLAELDAVLPPHVIIASSSSGLLISRIQKGCRHPERCVLGHPFNPPHLIPLSTLR